MPRRYSKEITIGDVTIGGNHPIAIQSMCNTKTEDVEATTAQILALEAAGCDIIRVAVPTMEAAQAIREIRKRIHIPLVGDIHFDYRLAIAAIENGADKIRINPGNIGNPARVQAVVDAAKQRGIPIRVGVNSGSLEKDLIAKYGGRVTAEGIVESALAKVHMIEEMGYDRLVISIKSSDVRMCVEAHELIADQTEYPLHVGITESGTVMAGNIKSAVGLGIMLHEGIGDTIRVSLTGDPLEEVKSAKLILKTLGLSRGGIEVVSCPTCGRTSIDLIGLANQVEAMVQDYDLDIRVAVMGCVVNGPGEAKEADIGIAGGKGEGLLIRHGQVIRKLPEDQLLFALREELDHWQDADAGKEEAVLREEPDYGQDAGKEKTVLREEPDHGQDAGKEEAVLREESDHGQDAGKEEAVLREEPDYGQDAGKAEAALREEPDYGQDPDREEAAAGDPV